MRVYGISLAALLAPSACVEEYETPRVMMQQARAPVAETERAMAALSHDIQGEIDVDITARGFELDFTFEVRRKRCLCRS